MKETRPLCGWMAYLDSQATSDTASENSKNGKKETWVLSSAHINIEFKC